MWERNRDNRQGRQVAPQTARTVDINPLSYTPPTGWKLAGGGGLIVGGLTRTLIIPVSSRLPFEKPHPL